MKKILIRLCAICALSVGFISTSTAQSACVGLSSSACSSKSSTCTWRKASVNKNGNKTKAHCRALPGKASKTKTKKATSSTSTTKKNTSTKKKVTTTKKKTAPKNSKTTKKKKTKSDS